MSNFAVWLKTGLWYNYLMDPQPNFSNNNIPATPPHKSFGHELVVAMAIVAVILYFTALYYYALWPFEELASPIPTFTPRPSPSNLEAKLPSDTSDWKTYRNEEYGFEFKYPLHWLVEGELSSKRCCLNLFDNSNPYDDTEHLKPRKMKAQFSYKIDKSVSNKEEYVNKLTTESKTREYGRIYSFNEIEIHSGFKVIRYKGGYADSGFVIPINQSFSEVFDIAVWNYNPSLLQILSTFRFIDPVDTSIWKIYIDSKYGISFKYPPNFTASERISSIIEYENPKILSLISIDDEGPPGKFIISTWKNEGNLTISEFVDESRRGFYRSDALISDIKICNLVGKHYTSVKGTKEGVYFLKNNNFHAIEWNGYILEDGLAIQEFRNIFSSFRCL